MYNFARVHKYGVASYSWSIYGWRILKRAIFPIIRSMEFVGGTVDSNSRITINAPEDSWCYEGYRYFFILDHPDASKSVKEGEEKQVNYTRNARLHRKWALGICVLSPLHSGNVFHFERVSYIYQWYRSVCIRTFMTHYTYPIFSLTYSIFRILCILFPTTCIPYQRWDRRYFACNGCLQVPRRVMQEDRTSILSAMLRMHNLCSSTQDLTLKTSSGVVKVHTSVFVSQLHRRRHGRMITRFIYLTIHKWKYSGAQPVRKIYVYRYLQYLYNIVLILDIFGTFLIMLCLMLGVDSNHEGCINVCLVLKHM